MDSLKDIRWKQRFENFKSAYLLLKKYSNQPIFSELEQAGIIQLFEMVFELAWKVLKDYLEPLDYLIKSPREAVKKAFEIELIENGHVWIDALADRNLTVHTYDEILAKRVVEDILNVYLPEITKLYDKLLKEV